jgi:hypothetical protein
MRQEQRIQGIKKIYRSICISIISIALPSALIAQDRSCEKFSIQDVKLPTYPPIARAAHMEAVMRFKVLVPASGESEITLLDGPSKGAWQILVANAREYLSNRKYGWFEGDHKESCSYTVSVEYRIIPGEADPPNNFTRVTVIDETRTLIEVKPTKPTVMY